MQDALALGKGICEGGMAYGNMGASVLAFFLLGVINMIMMLMAFTYCGSGICCLV